ncbi:hypothetical protein M231_02048 [Tremella mesenterica]|uniref:Uncharacterized protein n=1 Tax=Tremella mesenterica TaxID=5217 RepID=A0A4Q1BRJ6_TREME|nr:hypothetical protein M231_02048 [Tremella mesenterica]
MDQGRKRTFNAPSLIKRAPGNPGFKKNYFNAKRIEPASFYPSSPYLLQEYFDKRKPNHHPRPLTNSLESWETILTQEKIKLPPPTLISVTQYPFAIPCSLNDAGKPNGRPKYWLMAFKLNTQQDNLDIMKAWDIVEQSGLVPACKPSNSRSTTGDLPFHPGVWFPSVCRKDHTQPFLSKDARVDETQQFMTAFDRIAGGGPQKNLSKYDPVTSEKMSRSVFS